jgi:hypothetical protein
MLSFHVVVVAETKFCRFYRFDGSYILYLYVTDGMKVHKGGVVMGVSVQLQAYHCVEWDGQLCIHNKGLLL